MKSRHILREKAKYRERGSILVIGTMVAVVMLIMTIPFLSKLSVQHRSTERGVKALTAFNLAEAGADKVLWNIGQDYTTTYDPAADPERINWSEDGTSGTINDIKTSDTKLGGDAAFTLTPDPDPGGTAPVLRSLSATGLVPFIANGTVNRTVRLTLEKSFGSVWDFGFLVDKQFHIENTQLTVDSYDSREANYDAQNPGDLGFFAINNTAEGSFEVDQGGGGTINVSGGLAAGGSALTDGGEPLTPEEANLVVDLPKNAEDDVSQVPMKAPFVIPPVDLFTLHPKETWPSTNDISYWFNTNTFTTGTEIPLQNDVVSDFKNPDFYLNGTQTITDEYNGIYQNFEIAQGSTLYVDGNVTLFVTGYADEGAAPAHFVMDQASSIRINPGGSLTLILGRTSFYMGHQSTINVPLIDESGPSLDQPGHPADCLILGMDAFGPTPELYRTGDLSQKEGLDIVSDPTTSPLGTVVFEQQVDISAAIYTPKAQVFDVQGMNHADIYGAWIADSMYYKVAAAFHYDAALGDIMTIKGGIPEWTIINWHEKVGN